MPGPYNNPYTPYAYTAYQPYQAPLVQPIQPAPTVQPQPAQSGQFAAPQPMTPPTIHVDIIQVKTLDEVDGYPVNAGTTQLFQLGGGEAFITKEVFANGQTNVDIYPKQPKKPAPPPFDPSVFVTREELEERLAGLSGRRRQRRDEPEQSPES